MTFPEPKELRAGAKLSRQRDVSKAPEWRKQLLFWPADLWERWNAEAVALIHAGTPNEEAGHEAFERLKPSAPRSRLILPPTVPAEGCRCMVCDPWPAHVPPWPVKPGCDCILCAPPANGFKNRMEALHVVAPELLEKRQAA